MRSVRGIVAALIVSGLAWAPAWADNESAEPAAAPPAAAPSAASTDTAVKAVPAAVCDQPVFDFGQVWSGEEVKATFTIKNEGKAPLELLKVKPTCGCTVADYDKVIAPGKTGEVRAVLRTKGMRTKITKKITVTLNDPERPTLILTISGDVKPRISIDPIHGANFGKIREDSELVKKIKVINHTDQPMKLEEVKSDQEHCYTVEMKEVTEGKEYELLVKATGPFKLGSNYAQLRYKTGIEGETEINIRCNLYKPQELEISPRSLPISIPLTRLFQRTIQVRYNGEGTMKVTSATCAHEQIELSIQEREPGRVYNIAVRIPSGWDPGTNDPVDIVLETSLEAHKQLTVPLRVLRRSTGPVVDRLTPPRMPAGAMLGKPVPPVQLRALTGELVEIGPTEGKVTVLNFWTTWSAASHRQIASLQRLYGLYGRRGVQFMNVCMNHLRPLQGVQETIEQIGVRMPCTTDPHHGTAAKYGVSQAPTLLLIGKTGTIEAVHEGIGETAEEVGAFEDMIAGQLDVLLEGQTRTQFPPAPQIKDDADPLKTLDRAAPPRTPAPQIDVAALEQYTGRHMPGAKVSYDVYVRNNGNQPLAIVDVDSEGPGTAEIDIDNARAIQPRQTSFFNVAFTAPAEPGPFAFELGIISNDAAARKLEMQLTGDTRPYVELNPMTGIDFGRNPRTQTMGRMATLTYLGEEETIEYESADSSSEKFSAEVKRIGDTKNAIVTVNALGPFEVGEHTATITVKTNCKQQPTAEVPVRLYRPSRIEVVPAEVVLPGTGRVQRETVAINNNGLKSLNILAVETSDKAIRTQFYPEPDGFSYSLHLTFASRFNLNPDGEKVTIRTDDEEYKEIVIPIRLGNLRTGHAASSR